MPADPWSLHFTELPGCGRLGWRRSGSGPSLVLLHGLLGTAAQWRDLVHLLAPQFTCWGLELPGMSLSDPAPDMSLPGLARWLAAALALLGITDFSLIASSWGGAVALQFAAFSSPDWPHLRASVLVAPAHPFWPPTRRQRWLLTPPLTRLAARLGALAPTSLHRALLEEMYGDPSRLPPNALDDYRSVLRYRGLGRAVTGYAHRWRARQVRLAARFSNTLSPAWPPTLLVWGARDRVVPASTAPTLLRALPGAELAILPGLGHLPFQEDPAAFHHGILPFLLRP